jgi:FkbM family methyltransferase
LRKRRVPRLLRPYKEWAINTLFPMKTVEHDGLKFHYLRRDAPPHNPEDFATGIEFHQRTREMTGRVAIDIGANIGSYTLGLARRFEDVTAFEPNKEHCRLLRLNVSLNNLKNVHVYEVALSDADGIMPLYIRSGGATSLDDKHYGLSYDKVVPVPTLRLDNFLSKFQELDFIKMDAEGFELRILQGGFELISHHMPIIALEVHRPRVVLNGSCSCNVCDWLRGLAYTIDVTGESSSVGEVHWVWATPEK